MSEAISPPTDADRARRDIDWVKRCQQMYVDGFRVRQATAPPEREVPGTDRKKANPRESLAWMAEERCPGGLPGHERERWIAGFKDADAIAVHKGHAYLGTKNPTRPPAVKKAALAEPVEAFPEFIDPNARRPSDEHRLARWENREVRPKAPTMADEQ